MNLRRNSNVKQYDAIIIGGGAAGMMAAITAALKGVNVLLLEKNNLLGKKLLITGKGRCNITNFCDVKELIKNTPTNGRFMTNAFYRFTSDNTISFFNNLGLETKVERGNRVFPTSDKASDVVKILVSQLDLLNVNITKIEVESIAKFGNLFAVKLIDGQVFRTEKLVIATGGKSYPGTGSTGDGYQFAKAFGHSTTRFRPSLVPIEALEFVYPKDVPNKGENLIRVPALQGLSLKNTGLKILDETDKKVYSDFGEMLFTHFGVSGPMILSATSMVKSVKKHKLVLDLKPALDDKQLDLRLQREFQNHHKKHFENALKELLPRKMIPVIARLSGISAAKPVGEITKVERTRLRLILKNLTIKLLRFRSINEAIITSGGISVDEINPKTMESKLVPGLFFVGEVLDVDAYTGGFNLQIAWSSGYACGESL